MLTIKYMGGVDRLDQMTRINSQVEGVDAMVSAAGQEATVLETSIYNSYVLEGHVTDHQRPGKSQSGN